MISIEEAIARSFPRFGPLSVERVPLARALGRFLARDHAAREDVPAFDNSAMDGYAVHAIDADSGDVILPLHGESRAGGPMPEPLPAGRAMRIFTGAPLPIGADAVIAQEDAEVIEGRVRLRERAFVGKHVRRRAEDLAADHVALAARAKIEPGEIGLLASQGYAEVAVHRRPRVAIVTTGDELRDIGDPPRPGSLIDSNGPMLAAAVHAAGGEPMIVPRAPDSTDALASLLRDAAASADVVVTCGGVSVGEYDFLHDAFEAIGVETLFWKVKIKPGKPVRFGVLGSTVVVALPGNPVSALVTFELFVRPGLRAMLGDPRPHRGVIEVETDRSFAAPAPRTELLRASLEDRPSGRSIARIHPRQGSGALSSVVGLDALVIAEARTELPQGVARALDLRDRRGSAHSAFATTT